MFVYRALNAIESSGDVACLVFRRCCCCGWDRVGEKGVGGFQQSTADSVWVNWRLKGEYRMDKKGSHRESLSLSSEKEFKRVVGDGGKRKRRAG